MSFNQFSLNYLFFVALLKSNNVDLSDQYETKGMSTLVVRLAKNKKNRPTFNTEFVFLKIIFL